MKPLRLHLIKQPLCRIHKLLPKLRPTIDRMPVLLTPHLQEIVSEELQLTRKLRIIFPHCRDILFQCVHLTLGLLGQVELEYLDSQLHLHVVVQADAVEFVLANPSLDLVEILRVEEGCAYELVECLAIFHSDSYIRLGIVRDSLDVNLVVLAVCFCCCIYC